MYFTWLYLSGVIGGGVKEAPILGQGPYLLLDVCARRRAAK